MKLAQYEIVPNEILKKIFKKTIKSEFRESDFQLLSLLTVCKLFNKIFQEIYTQPFYFNKILTLTKKHQLAIRAFESSNLAYVFATFFGPIGEAANFKKFFEKAVPEQQFQILNLISQNSQLVEEAAYLDQLWLLKEAIKKEYFFPKIGFFKLLLKIGKLELVSCFLDKIDINKCDLFLKELLKEDDFYEVVTKTMPSILKRLIMSSPAKDIWAGFLNSQQYILTIKQLVNSGSVKLLKYFWEQEKQLNFDKKCSHILANKTKMNDLNAEIAELPLQSFEAELIPLAQNLIQIDKTNTFIDEFEIKILKVITYHENMEELKFYVDYFRKEQDSLEYIIAKGFAILNTVFQYHQNLHFLQNIQKNWKLWGEATEDSLNDLTEIFCSAVEWGRIEELLQFPFFKNHWDPQKIDKEFTLKTYYPCNTLLELAVNNGSLKLVQFIFRAFPEDIQQNKLCEGETFRPFCLALKTGNLPVLNYLFEELKDEKKQGALDKILVSKKFMYANNKGYCSVIDYIFNKLSWDKERVISIITSDISDGEEKTTLFASAVLSNKIKLVQYYFSKCVDPKIAFQLVQMNSYKAIRDALSNYDFEMLKCLVEKIPKAEIYPCSRAIFDSIQKNPIQEAGPQALYDNLNFFHILVACAYRAIYRTLPTRFEFFYEIKKISPIMKQGMLEFMRVCLEKAQTNFFYTSTDIQKGLQQILSAFGVCNLKLNDYLYIFNPASPLRLFYDLPGFDAYSWKILLEEIKDEYPIDQFINFTIAICEKFFVLQQGSLKECKDATLSELQKPVKVHKSFF